MIVIIDYGMGNIHSVARALKAAKPDACIILSKDPQKIKDASHLILPGQGAMPDCMKALHQTNLTELLLQQMQQKPTMGICVGMQMLFESSQEVAENISKSQNNTGSNLKTTAGLGVLKGHILKFPDMQNELGLRFKVPHMGWNQAHIQNLNTCNQVPALWQNIDFPAYFYFVHSYYLPLENPYLFTSSHYGFEFTSSILHEQLFATQFHPEKSGLIGLKLYQNFLNMK